jgi:hypothetical protein
METRQRLSPFVDDAFGHRQGAWKGKVELLPNLALLQNERTGTFRLRSSGAC